MSRNRDTANVQYSGVSSVPPFIAGKNKIINGDFGVWQRGTSFAASASTSPYTADRWQTSIGTGAAATISQQSFTAGAAPVSGYESSYFLRFARTTTGSSPCYLYQKIEDVRTLAGQTATISFWAKAASTYTFAAGEIYLEQTWGTGGTAGSVVTSVNTGSQTISTSWNRYSFTVSVPATTGKTIGTSSALLLVFNFATGQGTSTFDIWGVQLEAGSVATPFTTATGTIQGELAACQRYYYRWTSTIDAHYGTGFGISTTAAYLQFQLPVPMRTAVASIESGQFYLGSGSTYYPTGSWTVVRNNNISPTLQFGSTTNVTQNNFYMGFATGGNSYIGFSAEL